MARRPAGASSTGTASILGIVRDASAESTPATAFGAPKGRPARHRNPPATARVNRAAAPIAIRLRVIAVPFVGERSPSRPPVPNRDARRRPPVASDRATGRRGPVPLWFPESDVERKPDGQAAPARSAARARPARRRRLAARGADRTRARASRWTTPGSTASTPAPSPTCRASPTTPGQQETGATSPLWAVVSAPAHALQFAGDDAVVLAVKAIGLLAALAALLALASLTRALTGSRAAGSSRPACWRPTHAWPTPPCRGWRRR